MVILILTKIKVFNMTCIVGVKDIKGIVIAGDRAGSDGHRHCKGMEPKVFEVDGFVFGCTTSFRMIDILKHSLSIPKRTEGVSDDRYLRVDFARSVRDCLVSCGFGAGSDSWKGGVFLFSAFKRLFVMESDFQIREISYGSVGCGCDVANGYIFANLENEVCHDAEEVAGGAIYAASKHICGVSEEFDAIRIDYN